MMPIFNYKPIETLDRLQTLLNNEFDRISHYDLLFYSEMTKDMMQIYKDQDDKATKKVLCEKDDSKPVEETKDDVQIGASDDMDPALLAMLSKASKSKKSKGKAAPAKPAPK